MGYQKSNIIAKGERKFPLMSDMDIDPEKKWLNMKLTGQYSFDDLDSLYSDCFNQGGLRHSFVGSGWCLW